MGRKDLDNDYEWREKTEEEERGKDINENKEKGRNRQSHRERERKRIRQRVTEINRQTDSPKEKKYQNVKKMDKCMHKHEIINTNKI